MSKAALVERWRSAGGRAAALDVVRRWNAGTPLDASTLGLIDGRIDLRGFTLTVPAVVAQASVDGVDVSELGAAPPRVTGAAVVGVDLSGAQLDLLTFDQSTLTNVRFDGARLSEIGFIGCDLTQCSFDRARLAGGVLSTGEVNRFLPVPISRATTFTDCSFDRTVIDDAVCGRARFERCRFAGGMIRSVIFAGCVFRTVAMGGKLRAVEFDGRVPFAAQPDWDPAELVDVDFSGATQFDDVEFRGVGLDRVSWPARVRHLSLRGDIHGFFVFALSRLDSIPQDARLALDIFVERSAEDSRDDQHEWFIHTESAGDRTEDFYVRAAERALLDLGRDYGPAIEVAVGGAS